MAFLIILETGKPVPVLGEILALSLLLSNLFQF